HAGRRMLLGHLDDLLRKLTRTRTALAERLRECRRAAALGAVVGQYLEVGVQVFREAVDRYDGRKPKAAQVIDVLAQVREAFHQITLALIANTLDSGDEHSGSGDDARLLHH